MTFNDALNIVYGPRAPKTVTDEQVMDAMRSYGGSFVQALALAARFADPENLAKIKATWPAIWQQYTSFAKNDVSE